jgi:hypothetical protein
MRHESLDVRQSLHPIGGYTRHLRRLAVLLALLLPVMAVADQALLSYSLSSIPAAANNFWQTSRRNHERTIEQAAPHAYETPGWAIQGVRDVRLSLDRDSVFTSPHYFHHTAIRKLQPGIGDYFPNDTVGKSHLTGTAPEDLRWIYLKIRILGKH